MRRNGVRKIKLVPEILCDAPGLQAGKSLAQPIRQGSAVTSVVPVSGFLSIAEAAHWLSVSASTVEQLVRKGELITVQIDERYKIPNTALFAYFARTVMFAEVIMSKDLSLSITLYDYTQGECTPTH